MKSSERVSLLSQKEKLNVDLRRNTVAITNALFSQNNGPIIQAQLHQSQTQQTWDLNDIGIPQSEEADFKDGLDLHQETWTPFVKEIETKPMAHYEKKYQMEQASKMLSRFFSQQ